MQFLGSYSFKKKIEKNILLVIYKRCCGKKTPIALFTMFVLLAKNG
jgi:hypothetical protein